MTDNQNQETESTELVAVLPTTIIEQINRDYPVMVDKANRATLALSKITEITTDEMDAVANTLLAKVRVTYDGINATRTESTIHLDELKAKLMEPEKRISTLAGAKESEYNRVKNLRNAYAQKKADKAKADADAIALNKAKQDERIRVKAAMKQSIVDSLFALIHEMSSNVSKYIAGMNLENWQDREAKLNLTPKLSLEKYSSFLTVPFNKNFLTDYDVMAIKVEVGGGVDPNQTEIEGEYNYEKANAEFVKTAQPTITSQLESLPALKAKLIELKELDETNSKAAEKLRSEMAEKAEQDQKQQESNLNELQATTNAEIKNEAEDAQLQNEFSSQVNLQSVGTGKASGTRTKRSAIITAEPAQIVQVFAKVLFACFSNPKFKGYLKRDKQSVILPADENGVPVYTDWAQELLDFVANNTDAKIEGVEFKEIVSTSASVKK